MIQFVDMQSYIQYLLILKNYCVIMKKTILFGMLAVTTLMFTACKDKEQSEMTLDSIQGRATIQGRVMYDQGALQEEDAILDGVNLTPAKEVTVMVKVPYSSYNENSDGNAIYSAKTDANGNYSISVPVGSVSIEAVVDVLPFYAPYGTYENGVINTVESALFNEVIFSSSSSVSVDQGDITIVDAEVSPNLPDVQPGRNKTLAVTGKVYYTGEVHEVDEYEEVFYVRGEIKCPNKPVKITLSKGDDNIIYNITTDENGEFTLTARFYDDWSYDNDFSLKAEVKASYVQADSENAFRHFVKSAVTNEWLSPQRLAGVYKQATDDVWIESDSEFLPVSVELGQTFVPEDFSIIRGIGNPDVDKDKDGNQIYLMNYNDPMGWNYRYDQ